MITQLTILPSSFTLSENTFTQVSDKILWLKTQNLSTKKALIQSHYYQCVNNRSNSKSTTTTISITSSLAVLVSYYVYEVIATYMYRIPNSKQT